MKIIFLAKRALTALQKSFKTRVEADGGIVESIKCVIDTVASLYLQPTAYKESVIYTALPEDGTGDGTFVRAGEKTRVNESGLIETLAANVPSIDYTDGGCPVLLLEPQQMQLYELTDVMSTQVKTTAADEYTVGFYGTGTITFSGSYVGSLVGTGINDRVELTFTATAGSLTSTVTGSVTKSQLVLGGYLGSYIQNIGTGTVTRLADVATDFGDVNTFNSEEGTLFCDIAALSDDLTFRRISISDNTTGNTVLIGYSGDSQVIQFAIVKDSVALINQNFTVTDITNFFKLAIKWKQDNVSIWINGIKEYEVFIFNTFNAGVLTTLNFDRGNSTLNFYGKVQQLKVYKTGLSDLEIQNL